MEVLRVWTCSKASSSAHTKERAARSFTGPPLKLYGKNTARLALSEAMTDMRAARDRPAAGSPAGWCGALRVRLECDG
eukprot:scaffold73848_cov63-Phaeocystis_antarctica.AAC.1